MAGLSWLVEVGTGVVTGSHSFCLFKHFIRTYVHTPSRLDGVGFEVTLEIQILSEMGCIQVMMNLIKG